MPILPILLPVKNPEPGLVSNVQVLPPSLLLYMPLVLPAASKLQARRVLYHMAAYTSLGFCGLISKSTAPVLSSTYKVCFQDFPPSVVLYTPLSLLGEYKCPNAATQ